MKILIRPLKRFPGWCRYQCSEMCSSPGSLYRYLTTSKDNIGLLYLYTFMGYFFIGVSVFLCLADASDSPRDDDATSSWLILGTELHAMDKSKGLSILFWAILALLLLLRFSRLAERLNNLPPSHLPARKLARDVMFILYTKTVSDLLRMTITLGATALRFSDGLSSLHTAIVFSFLNRWSVGRFGWEWKSWDSVNLVINIFFFIVPFLFSSGSSINGQLTTGNTREDCSSTTSFHILVSVFGLLAYMFLSYSVKILWYGYFEWKLWSKNIWGTSKFRGTIRFRYFMCKLSERVLFWSLVLYVVYLVIRLVLFFALFSCSPSQRGSNWSSFLPISFSSFPTLVNCTWGHSETDYYGKFLVQLFLDIEDFYAIMLAIIVMRGIISNDGWFNEDMLYDYPTIYQNIIMLNSSLKARRKSRSRSPSLPKPSTSKAQTFERDSLEKVYYRNLPERWASKYSAQQHGEAGVSGGESWKLHF